MPRKPIVWTLVVALLVTGCAHNPFDYGEYKIVEHRPGDSPERTLTPYQAEYGLYKVRDCPIAVPEPTENGEPQQKQIDPPNPPRLAEQPPGMEVRTGGDDSVCTRLLYRSDEIGFTRDENGRLIAIAGSERIPVDDGFYCWQVISEPEFHGLEYVSHEACRNGALTVALALWPVGCTVMGCAIVLGLPIVGVWVLADRLYPTPAPAADSKE